MIMRERFRAFRLFRTDMQRAVCSWRFLLSAAGMAVLMLMTIWGLWEGYKPSIWYLMRLALHGSGFENIELCFFPVFAFGTSYALEWEQNAQRFFLIRSGSKAYMISKLTVSFVSGFLVVFAGLAFFVGLLCPFCPPYNDLVSYYVYEAVMADGRVLQGFLFYMIHQGITGGMVAVCSTWASTILPNRFTTAAAPFVLYFSVQRVTERLPLPEVIRPMYWVGAIYECDTAWEAISIKLGISLILCAIMGFFTVLNANRRLRRE